MMIIMCHLVSGDDSPESSISQHICITKTRAGRGFILDDFILKQRMKHCKLRWYWPEQDIDTSCQSSWGGEHTCVVETLDHQHQALSSACPPSWWSSWAETSRWCSTPASHSSHSGSVHLSPEKILFEGKCRTVKIYHPNLYLPWMSQYLDHRCPGGGGWWSCPTECCWRGTCPPPHAGTWCSLSETSVCWTEQPCYQRQCTLEIYLLMLILMLIANLQSEFLMLCFFFDGFDITFILFDIKDPVSRPLAWKSLVVRVKCFLLSASEMKRVLAAEYCLLLMSSCCMSPSLFPIPIKQHNCEPEHGPLPSDILNWRLDFYHLIQFLQDWANQLSFDSSHIQSWRELCRCGRCIFEYETYKYIQGGGQKNLFSFP